MLKLVWTPLTPFGMSHWIPEVFLVLSIGYSVSGMHSITKTEAELIVIALFLYPLLYYALTEKTLFHTIFGFGAGCLFSGVFLVGIWMGRKRKKKQ